MRLKRDVTKKQLMELGFNCKNLYWKEEVADYIPNYTTYIRIDLTSGEFVTINTDGKDDILLKMFKKGMVDEGGPYEKNYTY